MKAARTSSKVTLLEQVPLFGTCTRRDLVRIAMLADIIDVPEGQVLTREGEPGREFFVIAEGRAVVRRGLKTLAILSSGSFFGEISLLDHGPRTATVESKTPMKLFVLDSRSFSSLLNEPAVRRRLLQGLSHRLREADLAV